ncbi:hypothetical protein P43SY_006126 [Pythium insidiosum]|uniref:N(6)-L-threonylcarbamoyladenine synthase n=1 Tax=Pythium insidiosum TaxID=114742 RepID=A0AAD5LJI3_PYTIN|nr:hypothetical protein P43SY_006126 [Pythium insidiosum]
MGMSMGMRMTRRPLQRASAVFRRESSAGFSRRAAPSYVLGIETSCDDTAVAVVDTDGNVLSNVISSQWELNAQWKGIVPALAARAHAENLPPVLEAALKESGLSSVRDLAAIAVTSGPGLSPCLGVGLETAQRLAIEHNVDFVQINHLEAHVLVARLPTYELLGNTLDDSVGEAFDKVARLLDLDSKHGMHGGRLIEECATRGNERAFLFPEPMKHRRDCDFSYSGLKTAMLREVQQLGQLDESIKSDLCASFQLAVRASGDETALAIR